jgi:hypothetical protein
MRYILRRRIPPFDRVLLIESGARHLLEELIPGIHQHHRETLRRLDLVTCFGGEPKGFSDRYGDLYRVTDYPDKASRKELFGKLRANRYSVAVMICSGEPIMTKWKWALALRLPVKILILNENGDYFWLDWGHWKTIRHFVLFRAGMSGAEAAPALLRLMALPLTVTYLVGYAAVVHVLAAVRRRRLAGGSR